ncbi:fimbrial protein [Pseudomonas sp. NPDC096917]|uniref:fimbrial protein n=1 Tax=Pseudomonas sp. NPDC096917 TaxID=3364483 RepID=UPI00383A00C2
MKYLTGIFLLLLMQTATASQCRVDGGGWIDVTQDSVSIQVPVKTNPGTGLILLDGYQLECRYTPDGFPALFRDYWHTWDNALIPGPKFTSYRMGLRIKNTDYPVPVGRRIHIATMPNNGRGVNLNTYMYILIQGSPGNPIDIVQGDLLGTMVLKQTNNTGNPLEPIVRVYLYADNSFVVEPSTCTINNDQAIDVNFNQVDRTRIGESVISTPITANIRLNYSCPDPGITLPITITLKGPPAGFDSGVLNMSNPDLGTGLLRAGVQVRPEGAFQTNIYNSSGGDDVTFALTRRVGSTPATGDFSGSATLVMGVP